MVVCLGGRGLQGGDGIYFRRLGFLEGSLTPVEVSMNEGGPGLHRAALPFMLFGGSGALDGRAGPRAG